MSPMSALAKLETIQQKGKIMEYTDEFATLLQQCKKLSDEQISLFFLRGLKSGDMREKIVTYCHYFNLTQGRTPSFSELRDKAMVEEFLRKEYNMLTDAHAPPFVSHFTLIVRPYLSHIVTLLHLHKHAQVWLISLSIPVELRVLEIVFFLYSCRGQRRIQACSKL